MICVSQPTDDKNLSDLHFNITVKLNRDDEGLLRVSYEICRRPLPRGLSFLDYHEYEIWNVVNNAWGGDTTTYIFLHSLGRMRFMLVTEGKRRSKGEKTKPYMFSVTHYYANLENGKDVGLSMQVKRIKAKSCDDGDGRLDCTVDGPHLHPAHALFYMYDEIVRTRNPTCCPHCANNILQTLRMSCPSEGEDSDIDTFVTPFRQSHNVRARGASILENAGRVRGNYNGSLNIRNFILRPK
ncbi:hypothetical protein HN51_070999 [Arachis hypogaea]|nr:uncharacterized protein DS421_15g516180 [Arachis hypogaea]